jgi:hypothetical protein
MKLLTRDDLSLVFSFSSNSSISSDNVMES